MDITTDCLVLEDMSPLSDHVMVKQEVVSIIWYLNLIQENKQLSSGAMTEIKLLPLYWIWTFDTLILTGLNTKGTHVSI